MIFLVGAKIRASGAGVQGQRKPIALATPVGVGRRAPGSWTIESEIAGCSTQPAFLTN